MKPKKPVEPKPITAQPVGEPFATKPVGADREEKDRRRTSRVGSYSFGTGCYRKMPTCRE